jgi:hypothetical protein
MDCGTFGDGFLDDFLLAKGGSLKEFLEAYNIKRPNLIKNVIDAFVLVVIFVGLDWRRSEENVVSQELDIFTLSGHGTLV